ncbi:MAG: hypothetical protein O3A82_09345 [Verrucomicrobia bacterium]|nr:hypothetical protein [Verrucomicrobiota bacterium]
MRAIHFKLGLCSILLGSLVWWVVFDYWLPSRVEDSIRIYFGEIDVEIADMDLTWGEGEIRSIHLSGPFIEAESARVYFSYFPMEWWFGKSSSIKILQITNLRIKAVEGKRSAEAFWEWMEANRKDDELSALESLSVEGEFEFAGALFPFELQGRLPDFGGVARLPFSIDANATGQLFPLSLPTSEALSGTFLWTRSGMGESGNLNLDILFPESAQLQAFASSDSQGFSLRVGDREIPLLNLEVKRLIGETVFSGDWNASMVGADFVPYFPAMALFNAQASVGGEIVWHPSTNSIEGDVALSSEVSSFLFRDEGVVKTDATARFLLDANDTLSILEISAEVSDQLGERLQLQSRQPWKVGREKALTRIVADGFRLGRFLTYFPPAVSFSGELDAEFDADGALSRFTHLDLRREGEDWAKMSGFVEAIFSHDEDIPVTFSLECVPGAEMLINLFPPGGVGEVFGEVGAQGKMKLAGGWKRGALELDVFEGSLSTTSKERQLKVQGLGPVRVSFHQGKLSLATISGEDADVFRLSVKKLPVDGLLNWRSGRFQGDLFEGNGTVFFEDGRLGFRSDRVEVDHVRVFQNSKMVGENLNLRTVLKFLSLPEGGGELELSNLHLLVEGTEIATGDIALTLARDEEANASVVRQVQSANLDVDLTQLATIGLPAFRNLSEGRLRTNNLKVRSGEKLSIEMDGFLSGQGALLNEGGQMPSFKAGLRFTGEGSLHDFSKWVGLRLEGRSAATRVEVDFAPDSPAAKLTGENLVALDLASFLLCFSPEDAKGSPRNLGEFIGMISRNWQLDLGFLNLGDNLSIAKVTGEANASDSGVFDIRIEGETGGGNIMCRGRLEWSDDDALSPVMDNLLISGRDWNASRVGLFEDSFFRLNGLLDWDANGSFVPESGFVGEVDAVVKACSLTTLTDANSSARMDSFRESFARVLGAEPILATDKSQILSRFCLLPAEFNVVEARLRTRRTIEGKVEIQELFLLADDFFVRGAGEVFKSGKQKLSLTIGAKGNFGLILDAAGMLSEGKQEMGYRLLKLEPIVVEGTWREPDFVNLIRLLASGLGLAP